MLHLLCRAVVGLILLVAWIWSVANAAEYVPRSALKYRNDVIRETRAQWGMNAPIAATAAQIHQESGWRADASSAYASGLAEFTPDSAKWISGVYPKQLGPAQPLNPDWAIRALTLYDRKLWNDSKGWAEDCSHMAGALAGYNGGPGWITRDRAAAKAGGGRSDVWFGEVERFNAGRRADFFKENRGYPQRILKVLQPLYEGWGNPTKCS